MEPYPEYSGTYLQSLPRTTRQTLATYTEPLGRLSQMPMDIQREILLRMPYKDLARICKGDDIPRICLSEDFWDQRLKIDIHGYNIEQSLLIDIIRPLIVQKLQQRIQPGPVKVYTFLNKKGCSRMGTFASSRIEALLKFDDYFVESEAYYDSPILNELRGVIHDSIEGNVRQVILKFDTDYGPVRELRMIE